MVIHIGIVSSSSSRSRPKQYQSSKKHILVARPYSFLTNHWLMLLYHQMLSRHSKWTNPMVVNSATRRILLFLKVIPSQNAVERSRKWQPTMVSRRACSKLLRNAASMSWACALNAPQSAPWRMINVAWHGFSANKMILWTKSQCLRHSSKKLVMNVSSFQNSTVSLIRLKWRV